MAKLSPEAYRAARGILRWSRDKVLAQAEISPNTLLLIAKGKPAPADAVERVIAAFEANGVQLLPHGARLKAER